MVEGKSKDLQSANKNNESKHLVKVFGLGIRQVHVIGFFFAILVISNIYFISQIDAQERKRVVAVGETLYRARDNYEESIGIINHTAETGVLERNPIARLNMELTQLSSRFNLLVYLDPNHGDQWESIQEATDLLVYLVKDIEERVIERVVFENCTQIEICQENRERLGEIVQDFSELWGKAFPEDIDTDEEPHVKFNEAKISETWRDANRLRRDIARAWQIVPALLINPPSLPEEQARKMIIDSVGEEYFNLHFTLHSIGLNDWEPENWLTQVKYMYNIEIGNYSREIEVDMYFDKINNFLRSSAIPSSDNLMPFNVTREEAIRTALNVRPGSYVEIEAEICHINRLLNKTSLGKYVWNVSLYNTPRYVRSGSLIRVLIDPHTNEIYEIERIGWTAIS